VPEAFNPVLVPGVAIDLKRFPLAACDFMERHGVRGRGFSHFRFVGYQAWRFWPERERLPFMDIHQSGRREDRDAFAMAFSDPASWPHLRDRYRLDYVILDRRQRSGAALLDVLDADSSWAPVMVDDGSALYVARRGRLAAVADSFGFRWLGGGAARAAALASAAADSARRGLLRAELERAAGESPWNSAALGRLADLDLMEARPADAGRHLEAALRVDRAMAGVHQRLGVVALWQNDPRRAAAEFERERQLHGPQPGLELGLGMAAEQAGDSLAAAGHYRRELELDPGSVAARARLEALGGAGR
jgi:tetratricopeptide (TPR) repeat protein